MHDTRKLTEEEAALIANNDKFLAAVKDLAPDVLTTGHIIYLCGWIVTTYAKDRDAAADMLNNIVYAVARFYNFAESNIDPKDKLH